MVNYKEKCEVLLDCLRITVDFYAVSEVFTPAWSFSLRFLYA